MSRPVIVTDAAVAHYRARVRKDSAPPDEVRRGLSEAFAAPLFRLAREDGSELLGLIDPDGRRFLALRGEDGNVVATGPPSYWKEARDAWRACGWNINKGRPYAVQDASPIVAAARRIYVDEDLRIDHDPATTRDARGTWVQAWVLVTEEDLAEEAEA